MDKIFENEIAAAFKLADKDGDGKVTIDELRGAFKATEITISEEELQALFKEVDTNKNGTIEWLEFLKYMST
jgi:calmodulin